MKQSNESNLYIPVQQENEVIPEISELLVEQWNESLSEFGSSLFISSPWVKAVTYGDCEPVYLDFIINGQAVAKIAGLVIFGNRLQGKQLYFYAGPSMKEPDQSLNNRCLKSLLNYAKAKRYSRINIRPWDQQHSLYMDVKGFNRTLTHEFEINNLGSYPHKKISSRIIRNINKGNKTGAIFRVSTSDNDLIKLLDLIDSTRSRRISKFGIDYTPFYLLNLNKESVKALLMNGMGELLVAELDGSAQSILLMVVNGTRAYNLLKGTKQEAYKNGLSSWVDYQAILYYREKGYQCFNLGVELAHGEGDGLNIYKDGIGGTRLVKYGGHTYFLFYPRKLLNIVFILGKKIPDNKVMKVLKIWFSHLFSGSGI